MANRKNTFLIKRSNVAGKVPAAGDLQLGELALNTADNILYASGTTANSILPIGWDRVARTGDTMTGTLFTPYLSATTVSATTYLNLPPTTFSGGTVTGPTNFTNGLTANTMSATTYYGDGSNLTGISAVATEFVVNCRNQSGSDMYRGQVVYMNGSTGNKPTILLAQANSEMTSARTFGVLKNDIANNGDGDVVTIGSITNLDTRTSATHPFTIDTLSDGQTIYLSPTNAGYITNVKPYAPNHLVYIGKVVRTSPTNGYIEYQIQNGYELDELHDVKITGVTYGDLLTYSAYNGSNVWVNSKTLNGSYTVTGDTSVGGQMKATTVSATTYYNLPTDIRVTGGTYSNNTFTYTNNTGGTFSTLFNTVTGLTVNGNITVTGGTSSLFSGNSSSDLVRITQIGAGNAFVVEDSANPDSTPFVINNVGKVGIGTTTPVSYLDINLNSSLLDSETLPHGIRIGLADGGFQNLLIGADASNNISYLQSLAYADYIDGQLSLNPRGGKVGIGTYNNLNAQLHIQNTTAENSFLVEDSTSPDSSPFVINNAGNVGVGVGTPTTKLDVSGDTKISGGLTANTIFATTYFNLPTDIRVTGSTYSNNTFTFTNNTGGTFNVLFNTMTGLTVNGNITVTGSTNISGTTTIGGDVVALTNLKSMFSSGDEGGEIFLNKSVTNTTLSGGVVLDVYQNKLRIFESGGSSRGVYIDLTAAGAGVSTNLLSGGGGEINTASNLGAGTGLFAQKSSADLQFKSLTSTGGTVTLTNNATTVNLEVVPASNFTGGTVTGATNFTNGLSANTFSATTYLNLPIDVTVTGGTYTSGTTTFRNNTGGTFTVTGFNTGTTTGNGTANYLPKWTGTTGLGNSQIRDDGTNISIGSAPTTDAKLMMFTTNNFYGLWVRNASITNGGAGIRVSSDSGWGSQTGLFSIGQGHPTTGTSIGVDGGATDGLLGIGVRGTVGPSEFGSMTTGIGGYFDGRGDGGYGYPTTSYSVQLLDGTEGINKVLVSKTADGKANWSSSLSGLTGVYTNTISATTYYNLPIDIRVTGGTYSSGTATFTNNTGGTFTVTGFSTGGGTFTGGTVAGATYFTGGVSANTLTASGTGQNILTVIGSGNSTTSPIFSIVGSQGELFSVTDSLTGSLFSVNDISGLPILEVFSDNTTLMGSYQAPSLNTTKKVSLTAGTNTVYSIPTSGYTGAFFDYTVISSTGARAGTIMSIWSGATAQSTDVSTNDIGTTAGITFSVSVVGSNAVLSSSATTTGWTLKTIIRSI